MSEGYNELGEQIFRTSLENYNAKQFDWEMQRLRTLIALPHLDADQFVASLSQFCQRTKIRPVTNHGGLLDFQALIFAIAAKLLAEQIEFRVKPKRGPKPKGLGNNADYQRYKAISNYRTKNTILTDTSDIQIARILSGNGNRHFNQKLGDETLMPSISRGKAIWDEAVKRNEEFLIKIEAQKQELAALEKQFPPKQANKFNGFGLLGGGLVHLNKKTDI